MSNFDQVTKYLDLNRASVDETVNTKPLSLTKTRVIKKVQDSLTIPAFYYAFADLPVNYPGRLLFQYNVSVGYNFSFEVDPPLTSGASYCIGGSMFIKWRVGNNVFRYRVIAGGGIPVVVQAGQPSTQLLSWFGVNNNYSNELVKGNCVFEFWIANVTAFFQNVGLMNSMRIKLSKLRNPVVPDDLGSSTGAVSPILQLVDLGVTLPETLPYNQANLAWLDNAA